MRCFSLAIIGWSLMLTVAGILFVPRGLFAVFPEASGILSGLALVAALNVLVDLGIYFGKCWRQYRAGYSIAIGYRILVVASLLAFVLSFSLE